MTYCRLYASVMCFTQPSELRYKVLSMQYAYRGSNWSRTNIDRLLICSLAIRRKIQIPGLIPGYLSFQVSSRVQSHNYKELFAVAPCFAQ